MSATLWAGTNSGNIYVFTIAIPPSDKRKESSITVQLGKEIRLKHAAPVLSITVLDGQSKPFPPPLAVKKELASAPDTSAAHKVLICSEEQFKVSYFYCHLHSVFVSFAGVSCKYNYVLMLYRYQVFSFVSWCGSIAPGVHSSPTEALHEAQAHCPGWQPCAQDWLWRVLLFFRQLLQRDLFHSGHQPGRCLRL